MSDFEIYPPDEPGETPRYPHPPLDVANLMRLFGDWVQATNDDRYEDGSRLLRQLEEGGIYGLHLQRKGRPPCHQERRL
jgi:hypothetical protein